MKCALYRFRTVTLILLNNMQTKLIIPLLFSVVLLTGAGCSPATSLQNTKTEQRVPSLTQEGVQPQDLSEIFQLSKKEAGTKTYYSDVLGVGFTYVSTQTDGRVVTVTEKGSKIYVHNVGEEPSSGQSIEVFEKEGSDTLEEAIQKRFLTGYDKDMCFVKIYDTNDLGLPTYVSAGISFPSTNNPEAPWWENGEKCPQPYSETNGAQYFLANNDVSGKFLFVKIGQDSISSDGTPQTDKGGFNWSHSIRILK